MNLKHLVNTLVFVTAAASAITASAANIIGAGATFPYPIYAKWADTYKIQTGNNINYQSIGSGGGIKQIIAKTVDFGASDMPLTPDILGKNNLTQFPAVMGGVVPVINLPGVTAGQFKLDGKTLAEIYLGRITKWNHPAIQSLNPDIKLPNINITPVYRSDGSGTTFIFTNYLSKVSPEWKSRIGEGTAVGWKTGAGGKGNEGVAAYVQRIRYSIGYVEYAYAQQNKMVYTQLRNRDNKYVRPDINSFKAAANNANWEKTSGFDRILTDEAGADSWPITSATFIIMHRVQTNPESAKEVLKFFDWAFTNGGKMAESLDYVPLPAPVQNLVRKSWKSEIKDAKKTAIWQ